MIIPVFKKSGQSSHRIAQRLGEMNHTKATHTGTLDPLAEGVLIVLTDGDRFKKSQFTDWKKTYNATLILGMSTDTDDELGLIMTTQKKITETEQKEFIKAFTENIGTQQQLIHHFSAKRSNGKSYFDLSKSNSTPPDYHQIISIDSIVCTTENSVESSQLFTEQINKVNCVEGDFRQQQINENWKEAERSNLTKFLPLLEFTIVCSKRTYIRSLIRDVCQKTGTPAMLHSLTRTNNGPYSIAECICLI